MRARLWAWLLLILVLIVPTRALSYGLYVLILFFWLGAPWLWRQQQRLQCVRRVQTPRLRQGEETTIELRISQVAAVGVPWLAVSDSLPPELHDGAYHAALSLGGKRAVTLRYRVRGTHRGRYLIGPVSVHFGDALGLQETRRQEAGQDYIWVYPKAYPLPEIGLPPHLPIGTRNGPHGLDHDPAWVEGVRPYRAGDSPRAVHWPASARGQGLMVKQLRPTEGLPVVLLLDLRRTDVASGRWRDDVEQLVVLACSLAERLLHDGFEISLALWQSDAGLTRVQAAPRPDTWQKLLETLALAQGVEAPPFAGTCRREGALYPAGSALCLVAASLDPPLVEAARALSGIGRRSLLFGLRRRVPPAEDVPSYTASFREGMVVWQ